MEDLPGEFDFWSAYEAGWENDTHDVLDRWGNPDGIFIDVGAWVGPITLYAAPFFKQVIALEPDPVAWRHLQINTTRNDLVNHVLLNQALGNGDPVVLGVKESGELGDSMTSSVYAESGVVTFEAPTTTLWDLHRDFRLEGRDVFLKVDIEGAEGVVLTDNLDYLAQVRPTMWLSLHAPLVADTETYFHQLQAVADLYHYANSLPRDFSSILLICN